MILRRVDRSHRKGLHSGKKAARLSYFARGSRIILGYAPMLPHLLEAHGVSDQIISDVKAQFLTPLVDPTMPVQDAINLADFLVDASKKFSAFLPGATVVGGDIDIATVTKHEGFRWIRRKYYYSRTLNPKETGHAK